MDRANMTRQVTSPMLSHIGNSRAQAYERVYRVHVLCSYIGLPGAVVCSAVIDLTVLCPSVLSCTPTMTALPARSS